MGGGGGGYERPPSSGGSGDDSDESNSVPPPEAEPDEETEDQTDESNEASDETTQPVTGGGVGSGAPVAGPGEESDGTPEEEEPESEDDSEDTDSHDDEQEDNPQDSEEREEDRDDEDAEDGDNREQHEEDDEDDDTDEEDECLITETTLLHSPNPEPLGEADVGDICSVRLRDGAVCVVDTQGRTVGSIAEPWIGTLKECIKQGRTYRARTLVIDGGKCEIRVTNKCLLNRDVNLASINTAVRDQLHPELSLSVETTAEEVIVVTDDGSRVGDVPDPWARLLIECTDQGRSYQATVRDVTPEYCRVNIHTSGSDE
ncbi:hypothetical protein [Haloferax sp. Atlit-19N]|uniref:hypothetical protein n=1 Tax=Haloferax sp. Atlit-19N TaxID=2077201 RepID=UPI001314469F|nr:hypothetical protein [Haloferax sp. Atlit-19N]